MAGFGWDRQATEGEVTTKPKIKAIAPWFGGKRTLAAVIVEELGPHKSYWEPACGSMAVLFAKEPSSHETVNDLHGDLVNLARVVQGPAAPELYDRLQRTLMCEDLVLEAKAKVSEPYRAQGNGDADRAYWYFLISWAGRNGVSGTRRSNYQMAVRWTSGGGSGAIRFCSAVHSLPWWHQRLRRVEILCRDLFDVVPRIDDQVGTVLYLDPPYFRAGARSGSQAYLYDFQPVDHQRLATEARRFQKARVVVSYYDHPDLPELYPGWTRRMVYRQKNLHVQNRRGAGQCLAPEVLLINGPSFAAEAPEIPRAPGKAGRAGKESPGARRE